MLKQWYGIYVYIERERERERDRDRDRDREREGGREIVLYRNNTWCHTHLNAL